MNFLKKHWLLIVLALVVIVGIYCANRAVAFASGVGYTVLAVALALAGGFLWILPLLGAIYAFGYVWDWLPSSFYSLFFGSSDSSSNFSASTGDDDQ